MSRTKVLSSTGLKKDESTLYSRSFSLDIDDDDDDQALFTRPRFIHITSDLSDRAKDYNRRIKSNTQVFRFPYDNACYMHSASITDDYLVLTEIPFHFNTFYALWNKLSGGVVTDMFKWTGATMPTYFRIISLDTGEQIARIPGPPFFMFHHINSFQHDVNRKKITVDICAFDNPRIINDLYLNNLRKNIFPSGGGYVRRFELDLDENACVEPNAEAREPQGTHPICHAHALVPVPFELPRINPKYITKAYRYAYAVRVTPGRWLDALIKLDVQSKELAAMWKEPCTSPSEPIFVPNTTAENPQEDDGVVLSVVLDQKAKRSFLLVLDGITFKELARAYLPVHIPLSFHGNFY
jgi:beta,beta-carotene 9',10'-dioxygenase